MKQMKAIIYTRVNRANSNSTIQIETGYEKAKKLQISNEQIVVISDVADSRQNTNSKGINELFALLETGQFGYVIVSDATRIARWVDEYEHVSSEIKRLGAEVVFSNGSQLSE